MSARNRFLNSVSGVALTAALAGLSLPALADTDSAVGTATPGLNNTIIITSRVSVEAESNDESNLVQVQGIVQGTAASPHLDAIGVDITGWDIEASDADDLFNFGPNAAALAENRVIVSGAVAGTVLNSDFAPGSGSVGVQVADDIQSKFANAAAEYSGDGDASLSAIARNIIAATGAVAGSATDSVGVEVDGNVEAFGAWANLTIDNYTSPDNIAFGAAQALNVVGIEGAVGGEGASDGSTGFYVAGNVFAENADINHDGYFSFQIPQYIGNINGATVYTTGRASLDALARNSVGIGGSVLADGGNGATGVYVGGSVWAEGATAEGQAISDGGQYEISSAYAEIKAENAVTVVGTVSGVSGPATGVHVGGSVYAEGAIAEGRAIARYENFYDRIGGELTQAEIIVVAGNAVSITGAVTAGGGTGVVVGGGDVGHVFAEGALAEGFAGAFPNGPANSGDIEGNTRANATAQATNVVQILGSVGVSDATGVEINGSAWAEGAWADARSDARAQFTLAPEGGVAIAVTANASVTSTASNALVITGIVDPSLSNAVGVDPVDVFAQYALSYHSAYASAVSVDGLGATANAAGAGLASNLASVTGSLGNGVTDSTGVVVTDEVWAYDAEANGFASASAGQTNLIGSATAGATADAANTVAAINTAVVVGTLGDDVTNSTGVYVGDDVDADWADAYGETQASATVDGGAVADAFATAEGSVSAGNLAAVTGVAGNNAVDSYGVRVGEFGNLYGGGVDAENANAFGGTSATASVMSNSGSANASANNSISADNWAFVTGTLGDNAENSTGVWIGEGWVGARFAEGYGSSNASAYVYSGEGNGDATASDQNNVGANNVAAVAGVLGNAAEGSFGVYIAEGGVEAVFAEAGGNSNAFATVDGGNDSDAFATSGNFVQAGNAALVSGVLGDEASGSGGVWIGEGVAAFSAFAEGSAYAYAGNTNTGGNATASAYNTVTAGNSATALGTVGNNSQWADGVYPDGVYIGEGVTAANAFAEGSASADANIYGGEADGIATAFASNSVAAENVVSIVGAVGTGAEGSGGVYVDGTNWVGLPFGPPVPLGAGAINAFAEGSAFASAYTQGGTGAALATANNLVSASNEVVVGGSVGAGGVQVLGVGIDEGSVIAAFAEAFGSTSANATKTNGAGDATAQADGTIAAANVVVVAGSVGDASYEVQGVYIGQGLVGAGLAEGAGQFFAEATREGDEIGNATAGIGAEGAAAAVTADNVVAIGGTVSGINGEGGGWQYNTGVSIGEGVGAAGALADGYFSANAYRSGGANGAASATVFGEVDASNAVVIAGVVTTGDEFAAYSGEGSTGVYVGGPVVAMGAAALGSAYTYAGRNGNSTSGDATAGTTLDTSATNTVVINGAVGSYNDDSVGVWIGEGVAASLAFAEGSATARAENNGNSDGAANATAANGVIAGNAILITGDVGVSNSYANDSTGVWIGEGVTATMAFAEGSANASASSNGNGNGSATANATNGSAATNFISLTGVVGDNINDGSTGIAIGEGVSASLAFAEGSAFAEASRTGEGAGVATAIADDTATASNVVLMTGSVGYDTWYAQGIDPAFVNASDATAVSSATAWANGPAGSTATALSDATALNSVGVTGTVSYDHLNSTGVWIGGDVTATNALASASTEVTTEGSATGTGTATATALNVVGLTGSVGSSGDGSTGVYVGNNVFVGGLGISLWNEANAAAGTTITSTGTGSMYNIVNIAGDVGSGDDATNSTGVYIGGNVEFGGSNSSALGYSLNGAGASTALQVIEAANLATITGAVGTNSSGSHGVWIGGNVQVTNDLVSNFLIEGTDETNDGTTRGVWIGGSVLTGDALNSQYDAQSSSNNAVTPAIPAPVQIGDYVELAGSVFIGANGGLNPYGVAVGGGNDRVLVRDTHFQMEVVNGFDGGGNDGDGQDVITFSDAQIFVSNLDNFEVMNVTNRSMVILTNPSPYIYAVRDEVNINYSSILSFGDGGAPPPFPIASGAPVNAAELTTGVLTIGGINGVKTPGPGLDDSILKAENDGTGSYVVNAEVFNFGTITLSKVLSAARGTDPHGLLFNSATSFDSAAEQQYWAVTGSWNIDPTSGPGDYLTINGNYTAGSDVILDTFVFKSTSPSDVVEINGNVAGVTTVWINNTNTTGVGAFTGNGPNDGILVVDVNNGQDPNAVGQAFVLGNTSGWNWADPGNFPEPEMQVGAFVYTLNQGGPDNRNFYLQSQLLDQVPAYTVMTSAIQQHFYAELGTLYQRMGELRHADLGSKANSSFFEFWMRAYGQDVEINPKGDGFDFDMTSKGFMIGGDYAIRNWIAPQSRLHLGGFGGYGWTKLDDIKGPVGESDGKTDGYTLGLYATYFDTAKKHQGLYADAVLKFNFLDSEYDSSTRNTKAKSDDFAWGASLELGYGIGLGNGFIIQPQGQLSYMQVSKEKFKESSPGIPLEIERDKGESLRGRLGLQLQNTWVTSGGTQFSPYVIGNVLHEFMGDNDTTVSGTKFTNDMGGTWYNAGAGFTVDFDNFGLYGHVEYNFGNRIEGLGAGLGVKVRLGGSTPAAAVAPAPAPAPAPKKNYIVFFDFDRSNITADAQRVIDEAASAAKAGNSARVQLTGHTDRSGSEQYNMALSLRRGEAVKQALIARGIPANSIAIIGRGESQPLVPTADGVREPQNRRVEIML